MKGICFWLISYKPSLVHKEEAVCACVRYSGEKLVDGEEA